MQTFNISEFDYTDNFIYLQTDTVFYRGIKSDKKLSETEILRDRPMYVSSKDIAALYGKIYILKTKTSLRLLDLRKIMNLLNYILDYTDDYNGNLMLMIAYGLVPYNLQIQMFQNFIEDMFKRGMVKQKAISDIQNKIEYMKNFKFTNIPRNPVITKGVRIGEPYIDMKCLMILKYMLKDVCDGYIAPKLKSPYHINDEAHDEIVIFDPVNNLELIDDDIDIINALKLNQKPISINIYEHNKPVVLTPKVKIFISKNGGGKNIKHIDKNEIFNNKKLYKEANMFAKKYVKSLKVSIHSTIADLKPHKAYFDV